MSVLDVVWALVKVLVMVMFVLNLAAILEAAGSSIDQLVKTTIFYANVEDFATVNEVYARHMPDPPPARSAPANVALPRGLLISIEAIATLEDGR